MKRITGWVQKHCEEAWFCVCVNACLLAVLLAFFSPAYETNDDMGLCAIVNGAKGTYDAHMIYVNYLMGLILTGLYRITDAVAWHALLQYIALLCAFSAVTYAAVRRWRRRPFGWIFAGMLLYFAFEGYIRLQYTKTAGIVSAAGMILLLDAVTGEKIRKRSAVCGILLAGIGAMYRMPQFFAEAFLMLGIAVYELLRLRQLAPGEAKKRFVRYLAAAAVLLGVTAVLYGADRLAYRSEGWQRYEEYNAARTELFDYGFPDYEKNRDAYEELGIDENAYKLLRGWNHMDTEKFTVEVMEKLIALKTPKGIDLSFVKGFVKKVIFKLYTVRSFWCFLLALFVWLLFTRHSGKDIAALFGELFALGLLYCFLYYQGRYLRNRVDVGIWMAASLAVLWISLTAPCAKLAGRAAHRKCREGAAELLECGASAAMWQKESPEYGASVPMRQKKSLECGASAAMRQKKSPECGVSTAMRQKESSEHGASAAMWQKGMRILANVTGPVLLILLVFATHGTWEKRLRANTAAEPQKQSSYREVLEYISADKEHLYIIKSSAVSFAKSYGVFAGIPAGITENTLALGGWPANTPDYVEKMQKYGITNPFRDMIGNEQIFLVDDDIDVTMEYLHTYYDQNAQATLIAEPGKAKIYKIE